MPPFESGTQLMAGMEKLEYRGPAIYRNGKIDMVLFPGGFATVGTDKSVTFHYYTKDHLGNNRAKRSEIRIRATAHPKDPNPK